MAKKKRSEQERLDKFTQPADAMTITGILPSDDMIAVARRRIANGEKRDDILNEMTHICLSLERRIANGEKRDVVLNEMTEIFLAGERRLAHLSK